MRLRFLNPANWTSLFDRSVEREPFYPLEIVDLLTANLRNSEVDFKLFQQNPLLFSAISKRASYCSAVEFIHYKGDDIVENSPIVERLKSPNKLQTGSEFIKSHVITMSLSGISFINAVAGNPSLAKDPEFGELVVNPYVKTDNNKNILQLLYSDDGLKFYYEIDGKKEPIESDLLLWFYDETQMFHNPFKAISKGEAAGRIADNNDLRLEADNILTGMSGGMGVVSGEPTNINGIQTMTDPNDKAEMEKRLQFKYGVGRGRSNWIVTKSAFRLQQIKQVIKEFAIDEGNDRDIRQMSNVFGIPENLLKGNTTYENQEQSEIRYFQGDPKITMQNFADGYMQFIEAPPDERLVASFDHVPVMQRLKVERANYLNTYFDALTKAANLGADADKIKNLVNDAI